MRRSHLALAVAVALWPATALANPGPNPFAVMSFFTLGALQIVAALGLLFPDVRPRPSTALPLAAAVLAFGGLWAVCYWPASLALQVPAALLLVVASRKFPPEQRRLPSVAAACAVVLCGFGSFMATRPGLPNFASSASLLGGEKGEVLESHGTRRDPGAGSGPDAGR